MKINEGFLAQMREATQLLQTEGPMAATAAIQRALPGASAGSGPTQHTDWTAFLPQAPELHDLNQPHTRPAEVQPGTDMLARFRKLAGTRWTGTSARQPIEDVDGENRSKSCSEQGAEYGDELTPGWLGLTTALRV